MPAETIAIAADHAGFDLKSALSEELRQAGFAVLDLGTNSADSVDYPDFGDALAGAVAGGRVGRGVLVCGTGIGISIAANRHKGIRAALCRDATDARLAREHNDANVLVLGGRTTGIEAAKDCLKALPRDAIRRRAPRQARRRSLARCRSSGIDNSNARNFLPMSPAKPAQFSAASPAGDFFGKALAEADPALLRSIRAELKRQQEQIELIASENIVSRAVLEAQGSVLTNKYAEGYPGRRYYGGCEYVDIAEELAIERAKHAVRLRLRERAAALRRAGQSGRFHGAGPARRHDPRHVARRRRPSDARRAAQHVGQVVQGRAVRRAPRGCAHRFRRSRAPGERAQAEADHRRRLRLSAHHRFRAVPRHRRQRRRLPDGRHGAFRRPRRRRRASEPAAARACRDDDDAQDAARAARRHDPVQRSRSSARRSIRRCSRGCRAAR